MPVTAQPLQAWRPAPDSGWLLLAAAGGATAVVAVPLLWFGSAVYMLLAAGAVVAAAAVLFSPRRTLATLVVVAAALPLTVADLVRLPLGIRVWEVVLLAACLFTVVDVVAFGGLRLRRSRIDGLLLAFLLVTALGLAVGLWRGHEAVWRNARYPFYYVIAFVALQALDEGDVTRLFMPLLVLLGVAISAEYLLEFLGAIDLSRGERFVRVSHRRGVVLPVTLLLLANWLVHDPRRWGRPLLGSLFLFTGLGLGITLGRGMWAAFAVGLGVTVWLWHREQPRSQRRPWTGIAVALATVATLTASVLLLQRLTGTAIAVHAVERSRTFVDYERDIQVLSRLLNYATALQEIGRHPLLGAGLGAEVTSYSFNPDTNRFETWQAWTLDNLYLTLWLKLGLAGLVLFPWLCWRVAGCARRTLRRSRDPATRAFCGAAVATLAAMAVLGLSDGSLVNGRLAALFAVLFGLVMVVDAEVTATGASA